MADDSASPQAADEAAAMMREVDKVEEDLRRQILSLTWAPGERLSLRDLTHALGCGRTPLRLALERLSQQGLVISTPRRGIIIRPINLDEFGELFELMVTLERMSARLAAERITPEEIAQLEQIVKDVRGISEDKQMDGRLDLDRRFHVTMSLATRNRHLTAAILRQHDLVRRYYVASWRRRTHPETIDSENLADALEAVLNALRLHDADGAERAMVAHEQGSRVRIQSNL